MGLAFRRAVARTPRACGSRGRSGGDGWYITLRGRRTGRCEPRPTSRTGGPGRPPSLSSRRISRRARYPNTSPRWLIERTRPRRRRRSRYPDEGYCVLWSEWRRNSGSGRRSRTAIVNASLANSRPSEERAHQPTTRREKRSRTTERWSQPSPVGMYVMSVTHARCGASG